MKSPAETATGLRGAAATLRRPAPPELLAEIWHVAQDLPVFLTAPLYRSWHLRWGATAAEVAAPLAQQFHDSHDPAGASEACRKQNQLICAALLRWRKTGSARAESAGRMWIVLRPC
jgi:hypothetical protein